MKRTQFRWLNPQNSLLCRWQRPSSHFQTFRVKENPKGLGQNDRGYTLHEHLDAFGLINMNGRAYDPAVARFLSPDPFIQAPGDWGNYNRYGYCMNNPLVYNDPSGYNWLKDAWKGATNAYHWFFNTMNNVGAFLEDNNISVNYQAGVNINRSGNAQITSNGIPVYNTAKAERYDPAKNVEKVLGQAFISDRLNYEAGLNGEMRSIVAEQSGALGINLGYANDGLNAAGTVAGGAELFTQANAGARITYTTLNGASSWISSAKVVSTFKAVGTYTVVGSVVVDLTLGATGYQSPGKTVANVGVGFGAWAIGGVPGLVIGVGYTILDKTGCFDGPSKPISYTPPSIAMPDATRVSRPMLRHPQINYY